MGAEKYLTDFMITSLYKPEFILFQGVFHLNPLHFESSHLTSDNKQMQVYIDPVKNGLSKCSSNKIFTPPIMTCGVQNMIIN